MHASRLLPALLFLLALPALAQKVYVDYDSATAADRESFACFFRAMLDRGILLPPSQFEAAFLSAAHSDRDVGTTLRAAREAYVTATARQRVGG